jgi:hypothetical protein
MEQAGRRRPGASHSQLTVRMPFLQPFRGASRISRHADALWMPHEPQMAQSVKCSHLARVKAPPTGPIKKICLKNLRVMPSSPRIARSTKFPARHARAEK